MTQLEIDTLVEQFEALSMPLESWTHAAHLTVATVYAVKYGEEAFERMSEGIQKLNAHFGIEQTPTGGYHHTLTYAYMQLIGGILEENSTPPPFAQAHGPSTEGRELYAAPLQNSSPVGELAAKPTEGVLVAQVLERLSDKKVILEYYSRDLIMTKEARFQIVQPDIKPLQPLASI